MAGRWWGSPGHAHRPDSAPTAKGGPPIPPRCPTRSPPPSPESLGLCQYKCPSGCCLGARSSAGCLAPSPHVAQAGEVRPNHASPRPEPRRPPLSQLKPESLRRPTAPSLLAAPAACPPHSYPRTSWKADSQESCPLAGPGSPWMTGQPPAAPACAPDAAPWTPPPCLTLGGSPSAASTPRRPRFLGSIPSPNPGQCLPRQVFAKQANARHRAGRSVLRDARPRGAHSSSPARPCLKQPLVPPSCPERTSHPGTVLCH